MSLISLGILASSGASGGKIEATGGARIVDLNGYRHHIFTTSGTFTVTSGNGTVFYLEQDGGYPGLRATNSGARGGAGGEAKASYVTGFPVSTGESIAVTVGSGNGGQTRIWASKPVDQQLVAAFGLGASISTPAGNGERGTLLADMTNNIISQITIKNPTVRTGGGGGGGGYTREYQDGTPRIRQNRGDGGLTGGGIGSFSRGSNGEINTGGGGGGGGYSETWDEYDGERISRYSILGEGGIGGSGYAIISYPL